MKTPKLNGQIMVIVLLLLSILSVVALTATMTTVRDSQQAAQNKQYQAYYSLGERKILDVQKVLGTTPLTEIPVTGPWTITTDSGAESPTCISITGGGKGCTFTAISGSGAGSGVTNLSGTSQEKYDVYAEIKDTNYIRGYSLPKDQDMLINLDTTAGNDNTTYLAWLPAVSPASPVSWNISYDYLDEGAGNYYTDKAIYNGGSMFASMTSDSILSTGCVLMTEIQSINPDYTTILSTELAIPSYTGYKLLKITRLTSGNSGTNNGSSTLNCNAIKPLFFRIRALKTDNSETNVSLFKSDNSTPLQRTITTVTSTSKALANASVQNSQSPAAVLESSYLLTSSPLSLFDYVLRTEQGIVKN